MSTSTRFVTKWVNLDFCEGYMKDKKIFLKTLKEKLGRYLVRSSKICTALKSSFFHCEEYMKAKIMSRVLDVVGETTDFRGHRIHGRTWIFWTFATQKPLRDNYLLSAPWGGWPTQKQKASIKPVLKILPPAPTISDPEQPCKIGFLVKKQSLHQKN